MSVAEESFAIVHLGCNANTSDAEALAEEFLAAGSRLARNTDDATSVVVMTCGFTHERQQASISQIERLQERPSPPRVIVSGCLPGIRPDALAHLSGSLEIRLPGDIAHRGAGFGAPDQNQHSSSAPVSKAEIQAMPLARIRVSRGCLGNCSFCAIPRATGPLASRSIREVRSEMQWLLSQGKRRILLSGEDVGAYGRTEGTSLGDLLSELLSVPEDFELTIESINPNWLGLLLKDHSSLLSDHRLSDKWYVPFQAATDRLLRIMHRPYSSAKAEEWVMQLRELRPGIQLTTDLIVGHPGELADDVFAAEALLERTSPSFLQLMGFDAHAGTPAAEYPMLVSRQARAIRLASVLVAFVSVLTTRMGDTRADLAWPTPISPLDLATLPVNTNMHGSDVFDTLLLAIEHSGAGEVVGESRLDFGQEAADLSALQRLVSRLAELGGPSKASQHSFAESLCSRIRMPGAVNIHIS